MISLKCTFDLVSVLEISKNLIRKPCWSSLFSWHCKSHHIPHCAVGPSVGLKSELEMESPGGQRLLPYDTQQISPEVFFLTEQNTAMGLVPNQLSHGIL